MGGAALPAALAATKGIKGKKHGCFRRICTVLMASGTCTHISPYASPRQAGPGGGSVGPGSPSKASCPLPIDQNKLDEHAGKTLPS